MDDAQALKFLAAGDTAFSVEFGREVRPDINARVMDLLHALESARQAGRAEGLVDLVPSFRALLVHYDPVRTSRMAMEALVRSLLNDTGATRSTGRRWRLPVCYDDDLGLDLSSVAERTGKTVAQVIDTHAQGTYFVYMIGFMPGFPFMGGLDPSLELPRRTEPRLKIPACSVAVAMKLTGIYPFVSPGGWHILGRTPVPMFDQRRADPILLGPGDSVSFAPTDRKRFDILAQAAQAGDLSVSEFAIAEAA